MRHRPSRDLHAPTAAPAAWSVAARAASCPASWGGPELQLSGPADSLLRTLDALRQVQDPVLGADIVELGLVQSLRLSPGEARLRLVSAGPDCPLCDFAADRALRAMQRALPDTDLYVSHDPWVEWSPGRASARLRHRLGWVAA